MVKRSIGLRGYIGEAIVEQWLTYRYPDSEDYSIKKQIMPKGVEKCGGPYLDFGILKSGKVEKVYEVKTQDYRVTTLNKSLKYIWDNEGEITAFEVQYEGEYPASPNVEAFLISLKEPDFGKIGISPEFKNNVISFEEIFGEANFQLNRKMIKYDFLKDFDDEINSLKKFTYCWRH
jgi:hypothetical protein